MPEVIDAPATKKYYRKEIASSPLYLKTGGKAPFVEVGGNVGVLETEDPGLILSLTQAIARKMGGVVEMTVEEFEELKKNPPVTRSRPSSLQPWGQSNPSNGQGVGAVAVEPVRTAQIKVPDKEPLLAQLSDLKKKPSRLSDAMELAKKAAAQ